MIELFVNGDDKAASIAFGSITGTNIINQQTDTLTFSCIPTPEFPFAPEVNDEIELHVDSGIIFGGVVVKIKRETVGTTLMVIAECSDYSFHLDRYLVIEKYEDMTLGDIVRDIVDNFTDGTFTTDGVVADDVMISSVAFARVPVSQAFDKLAKFTNYQYYVDPEKDIHFFARTGEAAPFTAEDDNDTVISETLETSSDLSQIRNRVYIEGGEAEGVERTETLSGDDTKLIFPLATKFAHKPVVEVDSVVQDVGIDFLDPEDDFDVFWSFQQKSLRFKDTTIPATGDNNIEVTGIPLFIIVAQVEDPVSIAEFGVFEFAKTDTRITSRTEAIETGRAELQAYASGINEGTFSTYQPGVRAGQIITVNSALHGINEDFVIQRVRYRMATTERVVFDITLATLRTIGIIQLLIDLLRQGQRGISDSEDVVLNLAVYKAEGLTISEVITTSTSHNLQEDELEVAEDTQAALDHGTIFVLGDYYPTGFADTKRLFILDASRLG